MTDKVYGDLVRSEQRQEQSGRLACSSQCV